jgi:hypothetical protein
MAIKPGISVSAILISLRPQSAKPMSAMAQSALTVVFKRAFMVCSKLKSLKPHLGETLNEKESSSRIKVDERGCNVGFRASRPRHLLKWGPLQRSSELRKLY